jgi:hypothetical protein
MKYMLLIYAEEDAWTEEERQECYATSTALAHELNAAGKFLGASPLHPASTATCVRVRNARPLITDGPFTEAREQLGGYFMVEARDLDEALAIAARIPGAAKGTVEVRPVIEIPNLPKNLASDVDLAGAASTHR